MLERLKMEPAGWRRERLLAIKMGLEGEQTLEQIAAGVGHARSTVQEWFALYRAGGIEALRELHRGKGPPSRLNAEAAEALRAGLAAGRWRTAGQVRAFFSAGAPGWRLWGLIRSARCAVGDGLNALRPAHRNAARVGTARRATDGQRATEIGVAIRLWRGTEVLDFQSGRAELRYESETSASLR